MFWLRGSIAVAKNLHLCDIWSPLLVDRGWRRGHNRPRFQLMFSARRFSTPQKPCPKLPFPYDGSILQAYADTIAGPYKNVEEAGALDKQHGCSEAVAHRLPHASTIGGCAGASGQCEKVMRLGPSIFVESGQNGTAWLAYEFYSNQPPTTPAEKAASGEYIALTRLNPLDVGRVDCTQQPNVSSLVVTNPRDDSFLLALARYCPRCGEMLSFTKGRNNETMPFGVTEAPTLFQRKDMVYMIGAMSAWDSAYYSAFFVAAPSVPGSRGIGSCRVHSYPYYGCTCRMAKCYFIIPHLT
eukprot:SAG31_NODE_4179_length_3499_cov_5.939412_3_plen_297_part_00